MITALLLSTVTPSLVTPRSIGRPQARSQGVRGVQRTPSNLSKGPLLATKWAKNGIFVGGLRGMRFKKSTFLVQKVHFLGGPAPPKIDPAWLRAWASMLQTNQKFHQKLSLFGCKIMLKLVSHTIKFSKMLFFCWNHFFIRKMKIQMADYHKHVARYVTWRSFKSCEKLGFTSQNMSSDVL